MATPIPISRNNNGRGAHLANDSGDRGFPDGGQAKIGSDFFGYRPQGMGLNGPGGLGLYNWAQLDPAANQWRGHGSPIPGSAPPAATAASQPASAPIAPSTGATGSTGYDRIEAMRESMANMGELEGTGLGKALTEYLGEQIDPTKARASAAAVNPGNAADQIGSFMQTDAFKDTLTGRDNSTPQVTGRDYTVIPWDKSKPQGFSMDHARATFAALGMKLPEELESQMASLGAQLMGSRGQGMPGILRQLPLRDVTEGSPQSRFAVKGGGLNTLQW